MNIMSAKAQIKDAIEAYFQKDDTGMYLVDPVHQRPIFLLGAPGIGKTAIMEQIAQELNIGIVSYSMTHHTRQSALGLPRIQHREFEGYEFEASEYTMSEIVASVYEYMEKTGLRQGILFLDEINCVSETLYPSMLQFLQFKVFGKHKVPDDWVIVCAGNPPEYNRSVHEFDIVTLDRLREIDIEPEYKAWKNYALAKGLHPAVTTFLEAKKDCFYKVESKPGGGKLFVTARGWEDLATVISLYERQQKKVDRDLIVQFLRDDDIADQFAVYYALFDKYRSDYQVTSILSGEAGNDIKKRADKAEFDERVALLGLLLDALAGECSEPLEQEALALALRDVLREAKPEFFAGASVDEALGSRIAAKQARFDRMKDSGAFSKDRLRKELLVIRTLKDFASQCTMENTLSGDTAFHTIERAYKALVSSIKPMADAASARMDNAFDFVDECFGRREMLVFLAELTTRTTTTQFIAHYGNEKYYEHNNELQVDAARMGLSERVEELESFNKTVEEAKLPDAVANVDGAIHLTSDREMNRMARAAAKEGAPSAASLESYYGAKQFEYNFCSLCKMTLPAAALKGKKVLDVGCRRGKGVFKISSLVGDKGEAYGVDWNPGFIAEAKDGSERAWRKSNLAANNMSFRVAYPEDLISAGFGSGTMDAVYVNNAINLFYDPAVALKEFSRVLKPGGLLILETVYSDVEQDKAVIAEAIELNNSIQASRTWGQNIAWLQEAGFGEPQIQEENRVTVEQGALEDHTVPAAASTLEVQYTAVAIFVNKL